MKCELAASLLHQPAILFLDEPTIGLDAVSKLAVREFIRKANREHGTTVILTTHDMDDIEALCSRIILIGNGKVLLDGGISQLRDRSESVRTVRIEFAGCPGRLSFPSAETVKQEGCFAEVRYNPSATSAADLVKAISQHAEIKDFTVEDPPIDEIVAKMYAELDA
jgi:ABC-2 type transport system ATP-binding protein